MFGDTARKAWVRRTVKERIKKKVVTNQISQPEATRDNQKLEQVEVFQLVREDAEGRNCTITAWLNVEFCRKKLQPAMAVARDRSLTGQVLAYTLDNERRSFSQTKQLLEPFGLIIIVRTAGELRTTFTCREMRLVKGKTQTIERKHLTPQELQQFHWVRYS